MMQYHIVLQYAAAASTRRACAPRSAPNMRRAKTRLVLTTNRHSLDLHLHAPGKSHTRIYRAGKKTLYRKPGFAMPGSMFHRVVSVTTGGLAVPAWSSCAEWWAASLPEDLSFKNSV